MEVNSYIDHTLLKASATEKEIINLCEEAKQYQFFSVCINGCFVPLAKQLLEESSVKICSVIGFPLGAMSTEAKVLEAKKAIEDGADEIDMVINIGLLKSRNYFRVLKDISDVKIAIGKTPLKVILEISELSKNEIIKASEICMDAKADFIKTSTGFSKSGATFTAIKFIRRTVRDKVKVKASGGISDLKTAQKYIEAGVAGIGTTFGVTIVNTKVTSLV
ncbi:deoxyribose-phosphate aldolase [Flavobacteriaceae bacterium LMO-SS05]|jgi:deoxyribose-phosphate aldolase